MSYQNNFSWLSREGFFHPQNHSSLQAPSLLIKFCFTHVVSETEGNLVRLMMCTPTNSIKIFFKLTVIYSSKRCFQLSLRLIRWFHCSVNLATSLRILRVSSRFWSSADKKRESASNAVTGLKFSKSWINNCHWNKPSVSLVSDSGGSLATYCRPLIKLLSTMGLLSSNCLLNALWSSYERFRKRKGKFWLHFTVV